MVGQNYRRPLVAVQKQLLFLYVQQCFNRLVQRLFVGFGGHVVDYAAVDERLDI